MLGALSLFFSLFWDDDDEEKPTIEGDIRSSDGWKVKVGDTRVDFLGGVQQVAVLAARLSPSWMGGGGIKSPSTGELKEFTSDFGGTTRADMIERFIRYKASPLVSNIWTIADDWTDAVGNRQSPTSLIANSLTPLSLQGTADVIGDKGVGGVPYAVGAFFGLRINTFGPRTSYRLSNEEERKELIERDLRRTQWDSQDPGYSEYLDLETLAKFEAKREQRKRSLVHTATGDPDRDRYESDESFEKAIEARDKALETIKTTGWSFDEARELLEKHYKSPKERRGGGTMYKKPVLDRIMKLKGILRDTDN